MSKPDYVQNPSELLKVPILALLFGLGSPLVIGWLTIPLGIGIELLFRSRRVPAAALGGTASRFSDSGHLHFLYAFRQQSEVTEARMKARSLLAPFLGAIALLAAGCSNTPTESSSAPATGTLVISLTQPCPLAGSVSVVAGGTRLGALVVPGQNSFSVPAGSYSLSFVRGQQAFAATGQVQVPAGGTVVVTDPPAACMSSTGAP